MTENTEPNTKEDKPMNTFTPTVVILFMFFSFSFVGASLHKAITGHKIDETMAAKNRTRKIIQITASANYVYALCDDNTIWRSYTGTNDGWEPIQKEIPQN